MSAGRVRVLVVDDSATVRASIRQVLEAAGDMEVVGEANDGATAVALCGQLRPNVVTLDLVLPGMNGIAVTEQIMARFPTPILVVSAAANRAELYDTYDALAAGAVDVLDKPGVADGAGAWEAKLLAAVRMVARIRVITHPRGRLNPLRDAARGNTARPPPHDGEPCRRVVALGASTGGPAALAHVLAGIPPAVTAPILVVLHIAEPFAASFAAWLGQQTTRAVAYAAAGQPLGELEGCVVVAPPGVHLAVRDDRVALTRDPERHACRPSVDVLFESLARACGPSTIAALLTGMGRDGAMGLLEIKNAGGFTIAQDEATSVVYGMPREAALLGAASQVLPLDRIALAIARAAAQAGTP